MAQVYGVRCTAPSISLPIIFPVLLSDITQETLERVNDTFNGSQDIRGRSTLQQRLIAKQKAEQGSSQSQGKEYEHWALCQFLSGP